MVKSLEDLIGLKIEDCYINSNKDIMYWKVDGAWYQLTAYGDCCSSSWYNHVDGSDELIGSTILEFEDVFIEEFQDGGYETMEEDNYGGDYIKVNLLKFKTSKGYVTIEFRNSSNGYYSGSCDVSYLDSISENILAACDKLYDY